MITQDLGIATAYGYAKSKGYTGTEAEFAELMASYASTAQTAIEAADRAVEANTAAQSAKTDASASKTAAQTAAQTATSKASEAVTAAVTANTKASEASTSAQSANQSAESASTSAQTATTAASTATTKASEASESATTASTAKTDAETARDAAAQSASEAAESARTLTIDKTLTKEGQAADAKETGDKITGLKEDLNPYHATLETGAMASGNDVANDKAVRTKGYIVAPTGTIISAEKYNNTYYNIYFYFYDDDYTYLSDATLNLSNATSITVPNGVTFVRFFVWVVPGLAPEVTDEIKTALSELINIYSATGIQSNRQTINEIIAVIEDIKVTNPIMEMGAMVNGNPSQSTNAVRFAEYYLTQPGDKIYISKYENKNWTANFYYYDKQFNYLSFVTLNTANGTFVTVPENTRYIRFFAWAVSGLVDSITDEFLQKFSKCISFTVDDYLVNRAITENAERITAVEKEGLPPAYFDSQLKSVCADIIEHCGTAGKDGASFMFITDLHWDRNFKNSPSLIQHIADNTPVNKVIMGGDYFSQFETSKQTAVDVLTDCMNRFRERAKYVFPIFGNHDRNSNHNGSASVHLSKAETFALINSWLYLGVKYGDYFDFFIDDNKNKTRYICLDTGAQFIDGGEIDTTSLNWMQSAINELSLDWHVIIFAHLLFSPTTWNQPLVNGVLTGSYTQSAQALFTMLDTINTDATNATVEGIVTGHVHCDYNDETSGGIPIVFTDTDSKDTYEHTATENTITSQCFDVITFDYSSKKIYCDRIGRGNSREISY